MLIHSIIAINDFPASYKEKNYWLYGGIVIWLKKLPLNSLLKYTQKLVECGEKGRKGEKKCMKEIWLKTGETNAP